MVENETFVSFDSPLIVLYGADKTNHVDSEVLAVLYVKLYMNICQNRVKGHANPFHSCYSND